MKSPVVLAFRRDIEGMRAVAIALVVAAHAGVPGLSAGFVGVDIFFVISGYLITGLLAREYAHADRVDLVGFYARRLRRLLPALALVAAVTALAAGVLLAPIEQQGQAAAAVTVPFWVSNVYFGANHLGYFDSGVADNLFLHTWSLGVEEQFYLIWPTLLLAAYGGLRWQRRRRNDAEALRLIAVAVVIGLVLSIWLTWLNRTAMFYSLATRLWEFALGGATFMALPGDRTGPDRLDRGNDAFAGVRNNPARTAWAGVLLLLISLFAIRPASAFPGWLAMGPALATAMLLSAGAVSPGLASTRLLSAAPVAWVGRVSYSWYLWHWPVLVLGRVLGLVSPGATVLLVSFSLALAAGTYYFVERPFREAAWWRARPLPSLAAGASLMLVLGLGAHVWHAQATNWTTTGEQQRFLAVRNDAPALYDRGCDQWYYSSRLVPCFLTSRGAQKFVLLGDSVGVQWEPAFEKVFPPKYWTGVILTKSSCPMVARSLIYERIRRRYVECDRWRENAIRFIEQLKPEVVVLGSSSDYPFAANDWIDGSREVLQRVSAAADRVIVVAPTPKLSDDPVVCGARTAWQAQVGVRVSTCPIRLVSDGADRVARWLEQAAAGMPNVRVISMNDRLCQTGECDAQVPPIGVYRDDKHLTAGFVRSLIPDVAKKLREPNSTTSLRQFAKPVGIHGQ